MDREMLEYLSAVARRRHDAIELEKRRRRIDREPIDGKLWIVRCENRFVKYEVFGPIKPAHCPACGGPAEVEAVDLCTHEPGEDCSLHPITFENQRLLSPEEAAAVDAAIGDGRVTITDESRRD